MERRNNSSIEAPKLASKFFVYILYLFGLIS